MNARMAARGVQVSRLVTVRAAPTAEAVAAATATAVAAAAAAATTATAAATIAALPYQPF